MHALALASDIGLLLPMWGHQASRGSPRCEVALRGQESHTRPPAGRVPVQDAECERGLLPAGEQAWRVYRQQPPPAP